MHGGIQPSEKSPTCGISRRCRCTSFEGRSPTIDPGAFIAPLPRWSATFTSKRAHQCGSTRSIRADFAPIIVRVRAPTCRTTAYCTPRRAFPSMSALAQRLPTAAWCTVCTSAPQAVLANHSHRPRRRRHRRAQPDRRALAGGRRRRRSPTKSLADRCAREVRGPGAGTGAQMWVDTNPGAYQDLARRYMTGLAESSPPDLEATRELRSCGRWRWPGPAPSTARSATILPSSLTW